MSWPDVGEVMKKEYEWIGADEPLTKAIGIFAEKDPPILLVMDEGGRLVGVLTEKTVMKPRLNPRGVKAREVAIRAPRLGTGESVLEAARLMSENGMKALPVVRGRRPLGTIDVWDLVGSVGERVLGDVKVKDIMTKDVVTIDADATIGKAVVTMREQGISRLPVVQDGRLVGLVTVHDVIEKLTRPREKPTRGDVVGEKTATLGYRVRAIMSTDVVTARPGEPLMRALKVMREANVSCLVAVEDRRVAGIMTTMDVIDYVARQSRRAEQPVAIQVSYKSTQPAPGIKEKVIHDALQFARRFRDTLGNGALNLYFKEHREKHGDQMHLIHCRAQLKTDRLHVVGVGEHWRHDLAAREALERVERQLIIRKETAAKYPYASEALERLVSGI